MFRHPPGAGNQGGVKVPMWSCCRATAKKQGDPNTQGTNLL